MTKVQETGEPNYNIIPFSLTVYEPRSDLKWAKYYEKTKKMLAN